MPHCSYRRPPRPPPPPRGIAEARGAADRVELELEVAAGFADFGSEGNAIGCSGRGGPTPSGGNAIGCSGRAPLLSGGLTQHPPPYQMSSP